jgi:hypothetical protein
MDTFAICIAGFISIDCGISGTGYEDDKTKIFYSPDAGFIDDDAGTNHNIPAKYVHALDGKDLHNVRSFAGTRSCYTLRSLVPGNKYIIRAMFKYGNYDGLDRPPAFKFHVGVNYRNTVNISNPYDMEHVEVFLVVPDDFVQVCLVNIGAGTPYISSLDLRPLHRSLYPQLTAAQGLALRFRFNFGPTNYTDIVRYPDDPQFHTTGCGALGSTPGPRYRRRRRCITAWETTISSRCRRRCCRRRSRR